MPLWYRFVLFFFGNNETGQAWQQGLKLQLQGLSLLPPLPVACQLPLANRPCFVPHTKPAFYVHRLDSLCKPMKCAWLSSFMNWETEAHDEKPCPLFPWIYYCQVPSVWCFLLQTRRSSWYSELLAVKVGPQNSSQIPWDLLASVLKTDSPSLWKFPVHSSLHLK